MFESLEAKANTVLFMGSGGEDTGRRERGRKGERGGGEKEGEQMEK